MARSSRSGAILYGNASAHGVANNDDRRDSVLVRRPKCAALAGQLRRQLEPLKLDWQAIQRQAEARLKKAK